MVDLFEHVLLFAICILIMRLSLPISTFNKEIIMRDEDVPLNFFVDAAMTASFAAAMAAPLWVALEVIWWGMNALLN